MQWWSWWGRNCVELLDVVVELVVGVLVVVELVVEEVELVLVLELHWLWASTLTVLAACCRFCVNRAFTPPRLPTVPARPSAALEAAPHCPPLTAPLTWLSWALRLDAWSAESRPELPPQAAREVAARQRPPARSARGGWRIRTLSLVNGHRSLPEEQPLGERIG